MIDLATVGAGLMALATGALGWIGGKHKRQTDQAEERAERDVINLMRGEVQRLGERVQALEAREGRMIRHIYRLEGVMRGHGIEPPPFNIDGEIPELPL